MAKRTIAVHLQQVVGIYIACKYKCRRGEVQLGPLTHCPYDHPDCAGGGLHSVHYNGYLPLSLSFFLIILAKCSSCLPPPVAMHFRWTMNLKQHKVQG